MKRLNIPCQIIEAGTISEIDRKAKVVAMSPEKLLDGKVMHSVVQLNWSVIVIDEPHLVLTWGTSNSNKKPFRKAMAELSKLNSLGTVFECHSATIESFEDIYRFFGRKNSVWKKQIKSPDRANLAYYLLKGQDAPDNVLHLSCIRNVLEEQYCGICLIYVQRLSDGAQIFFSLLDYCEKQGLIKYSPLEKFPRKPFAFLHAKLTEGSKREILNDASNGLFKILIATNSAGCGVNLPISMFVGWGLDPEPAGVVQASGRTARQPVSSEGSVIWVHNAKLHGRRVPAASQVRELLKTENCLRSIMNNWFSHGCDEVTQVNPPPEYCCSNCMIKCCKTADCMKCSAKLKKFSQDKSSFENLEKAIASLSQFLETLELNKDRSEASQIDSGSFSREILKNLNDTKDFEDLKFFLRIASVRLEQILQITDFIRNQLCPDALKHSSSMQCTGWSEEDTTEIDTGPEGDSEESDSDGVGSENLLVEEYFDVE